MIADTPQNADSPLSTLFGLDRAEKKRRQYTVFLVEDDPDDQDYIMRILTRSPYVYNIHCFQDGAQLIGHIAREGYYAGSLIHTLPTMILLDLHLPGPSGMDVLRELKDHPLTADIPVVIVTGDVSQESAMEALRLKANAYIAKPLHLDHIHEVMNTGWGWPAGQKPLQPD